MSRTDFRISGHPESARTANAADAGVIISAPGAGRKIIIHDILATSNTTLRETNGSGDIIAYAPAGPNPLNGAIKVEENTAVYVSAGSCTITYSDVRV